MKYTSFVFPFVCGILFVAVVAMSPFSVFAEEVVSAQAGSPGYTLVDTVAVFFKTFGVGFGATFTVLWLIVRLVKGNLVDRMERMETGFEGRMEKMEGSFTNRMERMEIRFNDRLEKMEQNLKESINGLVSRLERLEIHFIKAGRSPIHLTKSGQELLHESGGFEYLVAHKDVLLQEFSDMDDPFAIQEYAIQVMRKKTENGEVPMNTKWMYKKGRTTDHFVDAVGTELHDMVLRSKGIPVDEEEEQQQTTEKGV